MSYRVAITKQIIHNILYNLNAGQEREPVAPKHTNLLEP